jgi:hypothetical protein
MAIAESLPEEEGAKAHHRQALRLELLMGDGNPEPVVREARAYSRTVQDPEKLAWLPVVFALFGDLEAAAEAAARGRSGAHRRVYEAALAWRRGGPAQALPMLQELSREAGEEDRALVLWMLANVALETHHDAEAVAAVEALRTAPGGLWRAASYPQGLYLAALAKERLGDRAGALATVERLLGMWRSADPDLPRLADAKALRARLAGPRTASTRTSSP